MADRVRLECWPTADRLGIGIQLRNLNGQLHHQTEEFVQIDTGYSEEILLPYDLFESLNLLHWRLPFSGETYGSTVTGQVIHFIQAHLDVIIPRSGQEFRIIAQTFVGNDRFLIGRAFLRRLKVILDGLGQQTCLMVAVDD